MTTRILFSDLDGTLLDDAKNVSSRDLSSINEMIKAGHRFVIATGRPVFSAKLVARKLNLYRDGIYLCASNGGIIYDCGKEEIIHADFLAMDTVDILFRAAQKAGLHVQTYTDDHVVALRETDELKQYCKRIMMPYKILERIPEDLPTRPPKIIVICAKEGSRAILEEFEKNNQAAVSGLTESVFSNDFLLEYLPVGVSKGNAAKIMCDLLGIPAANAVAAGDEANDIPMLTAAGVGCVVANATALAKSHADYVCANSNNESAVSEIIEKFILG